MRGSPRQQRRWRWDGYWWRCSLLRFSEAGNGRRGGGRGSWSGLGLVAVGECAHHDGLAGDLAFDGGDAAHLDGVGAPVEDGDFDAELIAGNDGATKSGGVDAGEDRQLGVALFGGV